MMTPVADGVAAGADPMGEACSMDATIRPGTADDEDAIAELDDLRGGWLHAVPAGAVRPDALNRDGQRTMVSGSKTATSSS